MEHVFLTILNMSITASYLVIAVIVLRLLLKKAPKWIRGVLWALVAVRLVLPFSLESVLSLIPSAKPLPGNILASDIPSVQSGLPFLNSAVNPALSDAAREAGTNPLSPLAYAAAIVWLAGVVAMLVYSLVSFLRVYSRVRESVPLGGNVYFCDRISTPFVLGVLRPKIFLPSSLNGEDTEYVLAHERAHIKRRDHIWKPLGFLLLSVYWFNPALWAAYILLCRDIELACDERVIRRLGAEIKKPYSEALINCSVPRRMVAACPLAFGETDVKGRVKGVLNYKKPAFWVIIAALAVCAVTAVCLLTNPAVTELDSRLEPELAAFINEQIINYERSGRGENYYCCADCKVLGTKKSGDETTVYAWVLYEEYSSALETETGSHIPTAITVKKENGGYALKEYWIPRDGSYYAPDIKAKFPANLYKRAVDSQLYIKEQQERSLEKAKTYFGGVKSTMEAGMIYGFAFKSKFDTAYISLVPDTHRASFSMSLLSSTMPVGTYEEEGEYIIFSSENQGAKYTFRKSGNDLVFVADKSGPVPKYRYSSNSKEPEISVPDGAIFKRQQPEKAYISRAVADIDGDGREEDCVLNYGPTSGVFSFTFTALENGIEKYSDVFVSTPYSLSFVSDKSERLQVKGVEFTNISAVDAAQEQESGGAQQEPPAQKSGGKEHFFDISVKDGHIVLTENGVDIRRLDMNKDDNKS